MDKGIIDIADEVMAKTYNRYPIVIERGEGYTLWDHTGKDYIDFLSGIAVCNLGHAHPKIAHAVAEQAKKLFHVSNLYYTIPQTLLAEKLVENSFAGRVFFANSGAEANEAAIKLARKYFKDQGVPERFKIISMEKSFHGRTMATLSATGQDKIKKGFDPVLEGFEFVPFNDIKALENKLDGSVCAVMMEPIQGEGGVRCPDPGYLENVKMLCEEKKILLIFDEIQTGMGRTGQLFAYTHSQVNPDIMTLAKGLANGLPIGAMLTTEKVGVSFDFGSHASTFGGGPVVTAAALETLNILLDEGMLENCREKGAYFREKLERLKDKHDCILNVRGEGLLLGMVLTIPGAKIVNQCMKRGFLINCIQDNILRFAPPLIIDNKAIDALIQCLDEIL